MEIGIGRATLWGTWKTGRRLADEVEFRVLIARNGGNSAAIAVADLQGLWPSTSLLLREHLARCIGTSPDNVGIFTTQNHGVPVESNGVFDPGLLAAALERAAGAALSNSTRAEWGLVATRTEAPSIFCRRVPIEGMGKLTCWYGLETSETGRADCTALVSNALRNLESRELQQQRCLEWDTVVQRSSIDLHRTYLPPAKDDLIQCVFFREVGSQRPLGAFLRFAAHPATSNLRGANWHSGDYPVYACRYLEQHFGGVALFGTGPCGDQCPLIGRKGIKLSERIGNQIAKAAIADLPKLRWESEGPLLVESPSICVHVRDAFKLESASVERQLNCIREIHQSRHFSINQFKRMSDTHETLANVATQARLEDTGIDPRHCSNGSYSHPHFVLRLGAVAFAGLSGEPFGAYSTRLRNETLRDNLIVLEEANGYIGYVPTDDEFGQGGYEVNASWVAKGVEQKIVAAVKKSITELMTIE